MEIWVFRTTEKETGEIIREGILDDCVDVDIEQLTGLDTCCDRCLWDVQKFLNTNYKDKNYSFVYEKTELDIDEVLES